MIVQLDEGVVVVTEKDDNGRYAWCIKSEESYPSDADAMLKAGEWLGSTVRRLQEVSRKGGAA